MTCKHTPISITFLLLLLAIARCSTETTNHKSVKRSGRVELLRDTWGVPHIFSDTDAGAMYGLGYAAAEDRAFQMYYNLRIIQGRLAELVGDVKIGVSRIQSQGKNSALRNDVKMRTIGYYRAAQKVAANLDSETLSLLQAYSDGVNDYIKNHPNDLLYLFDKLNLEPEPGHPLRALSPGGALLFFSPVMVCVKCFPIMRLRTAREGFAPLRQVTPPVPSVAGP